MCFKVFVSFPYADDKASLLRKRLHTSAPFLARKIKAQAATALVNNPFGDGKLRQFNIHKFLSKWNIYGLSRDECAISGERVATKRNGSLFSSLVHESSPSQTTLRLPRILEQHSERRSWKIIKNNSINLSRFRLCSLFF